MKLVIAEKPSVAQSLARVIGADKRQDGYLEGNGYLVSWCVGHLVELSAPERYDERFAKWRLEDLPGSIPSLWRRIRTELISIIISCSIPRPWMEQRNSVTSGGPGLPSRRSAISSVWRTGFPSLRLRRTLSGRNGRSTRNGSLFAASSAEILIPSLPESRGTSRHLSGAWKMPDMK